MPAWALSTIADDLQIEGPLRKMSTSQLDPATKPRIVAQARRRRHPGRVGRGFGHEASKGDPCSDRTDPLRIVPARGQATIRTTVSGRARARAR
jgi:hypothetical protein